jgi:pyruvate dehydrogenase (quinone)
VLAITGMQATSQLGTFFQQEVHLDRVFMDLAEYNARIAVPASIPTIVDIAVRASLSRRTVSHITFPVDIQESDPELVPFEGGLGVARPPDTAPAYAEPIIVPHRDDLRRAADVLMEGERVVILAGAGGLHAREELLAVGETLATPIVKSLSGKAAIPDDHPLATGGLGLLGTRPSVEAMESCDTLLMVGTNYPYTNYLSEKARVVQIELDPIRLGNRVAVDVPLVGDTKETLRHCFPCWSPRRTVGSRRRRSTG